MGRKSRPRTELAILDQNQDYFRLVNHPTRIHYFDINCWNLSENITASQNNCRNKRFQVIFPYLITKIAHIILSIHDIDTNVFYFHQRYTNFECETIFKSSVAYFRQSSKLEHLFAP